ncbi:hypothetical protein ADO04_01837 [Streptococcus parauberis]|nr:hypothetical protein AKL14_01409 [Streptococcus parauberis]KYP19179.1 hypothetical protein TN39_01379 [Streptococcus parauberis]KYP19610.1 hypothetical protein AKL13_01323 [Streptococcus parauberis]KYP23416.1 hypothetical protein ADO04_01837 [Streptococcus parauberis]KYP26568.1 hypothetical protein TP84_00989 [Streptococcus parauberis]
MSLLSKSTVSTGINSPPKAISKAVKLPSPPSANSSIFTRLLRSQGIFLFS